MLAGEHLGGSHEKRLRSRVRRRGQREGRHGGLARAHVSQKQVVRGARGGQHGEDVVFGALLLVGQLEGQRLGQGRRARAVHDVAHRLAPPLALARLPHEHELEQKQLLVHEAAARLGRFGHRLREMDARQRRPAAHEAVPRPQLERQRVAQARARRERVAHEPAHPRRRHLLACGMHGDDHALCRALAVERLEIGVRHALEAVAELELSRHGDAHAGLQLVGEPRLAKARDHEHARAVHERDLHKRKARLRTLELHLVHGALDGARPADDGRRHRLLRGQVDVAAREVRDEVAHRLDAEPCERAGARRAHQAHAIDGLVERERGRQTVGSAHVRFVRH